MSAPGPIAPPQPWMAFFSRKAIQAGHELEIAGAVEDLHVAADTREISGGVRDPRFGFLDLDVTLKVDPKGKLRVDGFCTCPTCFNCKHVAAILMAAIRQNSALAALLSGNAPSPPSAPGKPAPALAPDLTNWLLQLDRDHQAAAAPGASPAPPAPDRVLYVIDTAPAPNAGLTLIIRKARTLKRGGFGSVADYSPTALTNRPPARFVQPIDQRIGRLLVATGAFGTMRGMHLGDQDGAEILEMILSTGRCYWKSHLGQPLSAGEPRSAVLGWQTIPDGRQRTTLTTDPPVSAILTLQPPHYYDAAARTIGPLRTDLPAAVLRDWLRAPIVTPSQASHLNQAMASRFPQLSLPPAQTLEVVELPVVEPQAVLHLATTRMHWWEVGWSFQESNLDGTPVHFGRVTFRYHGLTVRPLEKDLQFDRLDGPRIVRTRRHPDAERARLVELAQHHLRSATAILPNQVVAAKQLEDALLLDQPGVKPWLHFLSQDLPQLQASGWIVEYDPSFALRLALPEDWYADVTEQPGHDWFDLELGVQVEGKKINLLPVLLRLLQSGSEDFTPERLARISPKKPVLVPLEDGRQLPFPAGRLHDILATLIELYDPQALNKEGRLSLPKLRAAEVSALEVADEWKWHNADALRALGARLRNFHGLTPATPPPSLHAELRPYQKDGLTWLQFLREYDLAGILADDMGLGKTVQTLAHLLLEKEAGRLDRPCLVVAPTSLMTNWRQEAERFAPSLKTLVSHGDDRKQHHENLADYDLVITSYPLLPRDQAVLFRTKFHLVILDEAQYIKNPKTRYAQVACSLQARHRLCLTGTPLENHLGELWSQFNFLLPGFLGDETRFRFLFRNPIEKGNHAERRQVLGRRVAPFILRRRKEQVMQELPPKTEIVHQVELAGAQRDLYESIRLAMHAKVQAEIQSKGVARSQIVILDALLKLRQVCCDPRLVPLTAARSVTESAKLALLLDLLPEMVQEGRKILLFSQFTSMLALIEPELAQAKIPYVKLTGETTDRATPIHTFQSGQVPVFLISLRAGGTGLNLTAADTVIHYDPWWNPAVENQATDRAHRIGQDKKVFVYKLMTVGTVEEKISALQARKRELVEGLLGEGTHEKLALTPEDLNVLFAPLEPAS